MKQTVVISIFFCCLLQIIQTKKELEIGVIIFEEAKGAQIYNQLVKFDNPFTKQPQVALALIDHTSTNALFAKVKNITSQDFIIQFFSANTINATYRYLATTDESIYMNCSNYKASQFAYFKYPQFKSQIETVAFLSGYHHTGFIKLEVQEYSNTAAKLAINSNDIKQTAVGICFIAGNGFSLNANEDGPKFSGRIDSTGVTQQITFKQGTYINLFIEVQQIKEVTNELTQEALNDLKNLFKVEETKKSSNLRVQKQQNQQQEPIKLKEIEEKVIKQDDNLSIDCSENNNLEEVENGCEESIEGEEEESLSEPTEVQDIENSIDISEDELSEEEDDEFFYSTTKAQDDKSSVDFELQLTLLQDALKKKSQVPQEAIKDIIKTNSKKQQSAQHVEKKEKSQPKQKQQPKAIKTDKIPAPQKKEKTPKPQVILNNEEIELQLQQKETHVKSLKKALQLIDTFQEKPLEVVEKVQEIIQDQIIESTIEEHENQKSEEEEENQINQIPLSKGYLSPLIDDIPKYQESKEEKKQDKRITQKLDGYMQSFSEDTYTQKVERKKKETKIEENTQKYPVSQNDQTQLIQLTGQSHTTKIVYEASEDSLKKFEEDFERRKQEKMKEIKQQLLPENKPSKAKFQSLAQEDQSLRAYKDFFYN